MKISERFIKRLRTEFGLKIPDDAYAKNFRVGHWQRSAGAFTSGLVSKSELIFSICFYQAIKKIYRCKNIEIGNSHGDTYVDCDCKRGQGCRVVRKATP